MDANVSASRLRPRHVLAGLQAGVSGALAMLACLAVGSLIDHRSVWVGPNLFATSFYGIRVYVDHYVKTSWAGIAVVVAVYGLLGALWGCIWRDERKPWLAVYGGIIGFATYFLVFDLLWKRANPLMTLYAPDRQLELGHILWGMALARSPKYARRIAEQTQEPGAETDFVQAGELRSGIVE